MPRVTLSVEYEKNDQGREDVLLVIKGNSKDLKKIYADRKAVLDKYEQKRLVTPFLCGDTMILLSCGDLCRDHRQFRHLADEILVGYPYLVEEIAQRDPKSYMIIGYESVAQALAFPVTDEPEVAGNLPVRKDADRNMKFYSKDEILSCIRLCVQIKLGDNFILVKFQDMALYDDEDPANRLYLAVFDYIRRQLRSCDYEFKAAEKIIPFVGEGHVLTKATITKPGDFAKVQGLNPDIAAVIIPAKLNRSLKASII